MANLSRLDPIRNKYFEPLRKIEEYSDKLFYVISALSFSLLLIEKSVYPRIYDFAQIALVVLVVLSFISSLTARIYFGPRALDSRRLDLLSYSYQVSLNVEKTSGYYNNNLKDPAPKLGAAILENSLFSKRIISHMLHSERTKVIFYLTFLVVASLYRANDLAIAATGATAVFSEQVVARWARMEWFRYRCEVTYDRLFSLFQTSPSKEVFQARTIEAFAYYETSKANAGVLLSDKIFHKLNAEISAEWDKIRQILAL
jgi:hypothetical protein